MKIYEIYPVKMTNNARAAYSGCGVVCLLKFDICRCRKNIMV